MNARTRQALAHFAPIPEGWTFDYIEVGVGPQDRLKEWPEQRHFAVPSFAIDDIVPLNGYWEHRVDFNGLSFMEDQDEQSGAWILLRPLTPTELLTGKVDGQDD